MTKSKLSVMLIDDNDADNYFHKLSLQRTGVASDIFVFVYAEDAIAFLKSPDRPMVDLILLDINLPRMDGFEFMEAYKDLYPELKASTVVLMLSTSLNPNDQKRAEAHPDISGFHNKPLDQEGVKTIMETYFSSSVTL